MIIADFHIYHYSLPFLQPIRLLDRILTNRDGLVVQLKTEDGKSAFGDVPPFPGLSDETLELAFLQLEDACHALKARVNPVQLLDAHREISLFPGLYPSVAFGIEAALMELAAHSSGKTVAGGFTSTLRRHIKTNGLVTGRLEEMPAQAKHLADAGYTVLKIKVGREDSNAEIAMLKNISAAVGEHVRLRLDANRAWPVAEAIHLANTLSHLNIDYIEEPLADPSLLDHFITETGMPIALDESLLEHLETLPSRVAAFIIKPGIHGGVFETIGLIKRAQAEGISPVISSPFLSAIGLKTAATIAAVFTTEDDVMGLDTSSWLAEDFLSTPVITQNGSLDLSDLTQSLKIPVDSLKKLC